MSYVVPTVPTFSGVKNIERVVQIMQQVVADNLVWLAYSFGLAERFVEKTEEGVYVYPATFMTAQDHFDCLPNDRVPAFSFWKLNDPTDLVHFDEDSYDRWPMVESDIDFIVFANLKRIDNQVSQYVTRSKMRQDIINALSNKMTGNYKLVPRSIYENDMTEIYSGYSIEQIDNLKKQLPYWAIRVNCTLKYVAECDDSGNNYTMAQI